MAPGVKEAPACAPAARSALGYDACPMLKAGAETDSFCSKCNLILAHTIHAMVGPRPAKVECNTCHTVHAYRPPEKGASKKKTAGGKEKRSAPITFEDMLRGKNPALAVRYDPKSTFALDQVIDHATFGLGFISDVKGGGKVEVTFRSDVRVLVHARH
jgi:hypothetical protein